MNAEKLSLLNEIIEQQDKGVNADELDHLMKKFLNASKLQPESISEPPPTEKSMAAESEWVVPPS